MPDMYDQDKRSSIMRAVRSNHTRPETVVQQALTSFGYQFDLHREDLPGKPDIVFPELHKIIFVHGCFWHQHVDCKAADRPHSNTDYWNRKLDRNVQRDQEHITALEASSWQVLIVWECETRNSDLLKANLENFIESSKS